MRLPPWLEGLYASLVSALDDRRLPHALLIHGPGGWGEAVLAEALALRLIGRESESSAATIAHPDLRWIVPEGAGEQIGIDAVRAVADFIVRTPQIAPRKVAVITNADALNPHAANALLKTLEEPPPDSYLILVSDSLRDLLPTLRSRCRLLRWPGSVHRCRLRRTNAQPRSTSNTAAPRFASWPRSSATRNRSPKRCAQ
jgi:DNA polymerase-3 subunit delta'